jgi:hypothetical protein
MVYRWHHVGGVGRRGQVRVLFSLYGGCECACFGSAQDGRCCWSWKRSCRGSRWRGRP